MEIIISAVSLVLNMLIDIPSATVAVNDAKKVRVAKALAKLVKQLDEIIVRGYKILAILESLPKLTKISEFDDAYNELEKLLKSQIITLSQVESDIQDKFAANNNFKNVLGVKFQQNHTELQKILTIYEHDKVEIWGPVMSGKASLAHALLKGISESNRKPNNDFKKNSYAEISKYLGFDFSSTTDRRKYFREAKKRIKTIEESRVELSKLIQQHYEPHYLI